MFEHKNDLKIKFRYFIRLHSIAQAPFYPPGHRFFHFTTGSIKIVTNVTEIDSSSEPESDTEENDVPKPFAGHGIIGLSHQFEFFFKERDPDLYQHLVKYAP